MIRRSTSSLSERQQVVAIILMAGLLILGLWFFLLLPQNRKRNNLKTQINNMRTQLLNRNLLYDESVLQRKYDRLERNSQKLRAEWTEMVDRMTAFPKHQDLLEAEVGHIDYKVALFEVRQRLIKKSRARNVRIRQNNFGMEDEVRSDEDARKLMLQLRAVEKLVDLMFDLEVSLLNDIDPLPPIRHLAGPAKTPYIEEYPVSLRFQGSLENVFALLEAIRRPQFAFALRRIQIESVTGQPESIQVHAVVSALAFLKDPTDVIEELPKKPIKRLIPLGH